MSDQHSEGIDLNTLLASSLHEIKNQYNAMLNELNGLLEQLSLSPEQTQHSALIQSEALYLSQQLSGLMAHYRAGQQTLSPHIDQVFVDDWLEEFQTRHRLTQQAFGCTLELDVEEDLTGFFDADWVGQCLDTLIHNAAKAGARCLRLFARENEAGDTLIGLTDDGPGFPEEWLNADANHQWTPGDLKLGQTSTGLGLYFADTIVRAHRNGERHGQLRIENDGALGGARVSLILP